MDNTPARGKDSIRRWYHDKADDEYANSISDSSINSLDPSTNLLAGIDSHNTTQVDPPNRNTNKQ